MGISRRRTSLYRLGTFEQFGPWLNQQGSQTLTADHFQAHEIEQLTTTLKIKDSDFSNLGLSLADSVVQTIPGSRKELRDAAFDLKGMAVPVIHWGQVGCTLIDLCILGGPRKLHSN